MGKRATCTPMIENHSLEIMCKEKDMTVSQSEWISNRIILIDTTLQKIKFLH